MFEKKKKSEKEKEKRKKNSENCWKKIEKKEKGYNEKKMALKPCIFLIDLFSFFWLLASLMWLFVRIGGLFGNYVGLWLMVCKREEKICAKLHGIKLT